MGLYIRVATFLHWIWGQTTHQEEAIKTLFSVDLSDSMLQARQDITNKLVLQPLPLTPPPAPVQYLP